MNKTISNAETRYTVKAYEPAGDISDETLLKIQELLQLSPSSVNIQPWQFILARSPEARAKAAKAATGVFAYNAPSIQNCQLAIIYTMPTSIDRDYVREIVDQEDKDRRFLTPKNKEERLKTMELVLHKHSDPQEMRAWLQNQLYINLGFLLSGLAGLGLDATPMEGVIRDILNAEFDLEAQGREALFVVCVGQSDPEKDYNAKLPKSRLPLSEIVEII